METKNKEMMKTLISFIAIGLVFALGYWTCKESNTPVVNTKIITQTDTLPGDTIVEKVTVEKPVPVYINTVDTFYKPVDTIQILTDYFSEVYYNDTLKNDSSAFISVSDTISRNRIQGRTYEFLNRRSTKIVNNTTIIEEARDGVYVGGNISLGLAGVDALYVKGKDAFGIGVNALMLKEPKYFISFEYKRQIWKKER